MRNFHGVHEVPWSFMGIPWCSMEKPRSRLYPMEVFMGLDMEFPWSTWNPIVFRGNTTVLHGDSMATWYPMEIFMGLRLEFSWST